jgi:hypothetical protein
MKVAATVHSADTEAGDGQDKAREADHERFAVFRH